MRKTPLWDDMSGKQTSYTPNGEPALDAFEEAGSEFVKDDYVTFVTGRLLSPFGPSPV
jgi:hypothetical protein